MAIEIKETFEVAAPIEKVWQFLMDPQRVVMCMPGAKLEEVIDEKTFMGSVRIKVGAVSSAYKGRVQFTDIDEKAYRLEMLADGRETSGGTAKGAMSGQLRSLDNGTTEIVAEASVDLTGRIMQVGRGMIQGVSHQLFKQFADRTKKQLEAEDIQETSVGAGAVITSPGKDVGDEGEAIAVLPLLIKTLWAAILNFFRKIFGRPTS